MEYLTIKGFVEMERINGEMFIIVKHTDADFYRYRILKMENGLPVWTGKRFDTKAQAREMLKEWRMDARDARIQATRESLERKGINAYADHNGRMKDIMDAYRESKEI